MFSWKLCMRDICFNAFHSHRHKLHVLGAQVVQVGASEEKGDDFIFSHILMNAKNVSEIHNIIIKQSLLLKLSLLLNNKFTLINAFQN